MKKPKIICICGSTQFADIHAIQRWEFEKTGENICLMINYLPEWFAKQEFGKDKHDHFAESAGLKDVLDQLHFDKIDISDEVFVINCNGYIGESTSTEILYAISKNKPVKFYENNENHKQKCPGCGKEHFNTAAYGYCKIECYTKRM